MIFQEGLKGKVGRNDKDKLIKRLNIIVIAVLTIYIVGKYESDIIKKSVDNMVFDISATTIRDYYSVYRYVKESEKQEVFLETPFSLALQYENENGLETIPEPDHSDYSEETSKKEKKEEETPQSEPVTEEEKKADEPPVEPAPATAEAAAPANVIHPESLTFEYLMKNIYTVAPTTVVYESDLNGPEFMARDMTMKQDNSKPQILIYHTHGQEGFTDSVEGDASTRITGVGEYLAQLLRERYGYNVIHVTDSFDYINGVLDRSKAYDYAYTKIAQVLADNPSIEVVLDIHRDGVNENLHLVKDINGKPTAQIMFFNGMSRSAAAGDIDYLFNPNLSDNLAFSLQMKIKAMEYFPEYTRRSYLQAYEYNLQVRPKSMLIEVGAQTNSLQEEKNAMEPLCELLHMVLQ